MPKIFKDDITADAGNDISDALFNLKMEIDNLAGVLDKNGVNITDKAIKDMQKFQMDIKSGNFHMSGSNDLFLIMSTLPILRDAIISLRKDIGEDVVEVKYDEKVRPNIKQ